MSDEKNYSPQPARSIKSGLVDDNWSLHINIRWLLQLCFAISGVVYGYMEITNRLGELERKMESADTRIAELVDKYREEENKRFEQMEEELKWHQKLLRKKKK